LLTDASLATSSSLVAANPRVTKSSSAARAISDARSSGRRTRTVLAVLVLTDWSVSMFRHVMPNRIRFKTERKKSGRPRSPDALASFAFPPPRAGASDRLQARLLFRGPPVGPERGRPRGGQKALLEGSKKPLTSALSYLLLLLLNSLLLSNLLLSSHNCLLWLAMGAPTVRSPGYAGTLRHACSTAAGGAAAGRAFEARPVADHGEVAAFRTSIPFESLELGLEG